MNSTKTMQIDLNCDMGESFGNWSIGEDEAVFAAISSANIACGWHAGDPQVMDRTVRLAVEYGVNPGAHPGYPDLQGFGRREMNISADEIEVFILYQLGALAGFCRSHGTDLIHIKPHGALYNQAARDVRLAEALVKGVKRFSTQLVLVGLAGSVLVETGSAHGLRVANEGFPDRAYDSDGSLRSRRLPGAVLESQEEVCAQAIKLAQRGILVKNEAGERFVRVDTLCIHGDHPGAAQRAAAVRDALANQGIHVRPL